MTMVEIPKPERTWGDSLKLAFDMLMPVLLTAVIISLILFRVDVLHRFDTTARTAVVTACHAVKESNDASYDLWDRQIAGSPQAGSPEATAFLEDIAATNERIYRQCLADGTKRTSR